jgi:hypothetical protein
MRAKLIYEKFSEKSDPIDDMGIGSTGLSAYTEVWVITKYGDTDINEVFLNKTKAERIAKEKNKEYYDYYRNKNKKMSDDEFKKYFYGGYINRNEYRVKSLDDAIEDIKEVVIDNERNEENDNY